AQISLFLLVAVAILLTIEARSRGARRYAAPPKQARPLAPTPLRPLGKVAAFAICAAPVALGFALPFLLLLDIAWDVYRDQGAPPQLLGDLASTVIFAGLATALALPCGVGVALV